MLFCGSFATAAVPTSWPAWNTFEQRFITSDGRVVDLTFGGKSTSEGQSYGLFLALVANQPQRFATILKWTSDNLAHGQLGERLPAWLWGKRDDGSWAVKDNNSASDGDLWLAYTLLQAGRLWHQPRYSELGHALMVQIRRHEVVDAGKAGLLLLPGAYGFELGEGRYRIDPSYLPGFVFAAFAADDPKGPWQGIWDGFLLAAPKAFPRGMAADLYIVNVDGQVFPDDQGRPTGSFDAIRVYLWAGMSGANSASLVKLLAPYAALTRSLGAPPEKIDPQTGTVISSGYSPPGYAGSLLPFLDVLGDKKTIGFMQSLVQQERQKALAGAPTNYYDQVLILFGQGWLEHRYGFDASGNLHPAWAS